MIRPNFKFRKSGLTIDRCKSAVYCIITRGDANAADARLSKSSVKDLPPATEINFAVGVKILRCAGVITPDIRDVTADIARRKIECPTECHRRVREIATNSITSLDDVVGGQIRTAQTESGIRYCDATSQ